MAKRKLARTIQISQEQSEPVWGQFNTKDQFIPLLNWYSYNKSEKDAKKYFIEYLKSIKTPKDELKILTQSNESVRTSVCWVCRIRYNTPEMSSTKYDDAIQEEKNRILALEKNKRLRKQKEELKKKKSVSTNNIQENMKNQFFECMSFIDEKIDEFIQSEDKTRFKKDESIKTWLRANSVNSIQCNKISKYLEENFLAELREAQSKSCEQLTEGYGFLSKKDMKHYISFIEKIIDSTTERVANLKVATDKNRVAKSKKLKPPIEQIKNLKYLQEYESIRSIPPTRIVGANHLWTYNVKTRKIFHYVCSNPHGFIVSGTTIKNFNESKSSCKILRKPEEILPKVLNSGKVEIKKLIQSLKTKSTKVNGRVNTDTILLRAF